MHRRIHNQEERLSQCKDLYELALKRGEIRGLRESLNVLENLAVEIVHEDDNPAALGGNEDG